MDLSLTRTAAVFLPAGWDPRDPWKGVRWAVIAPKVDEDERSPGKARALRLSAIASDAMLFVQQCRARHVACEDHAFGMASGGAKWKAEVHGAVKCYFWVVGGLVVESLNIASCRKTLMGKLPRKGAGVAVATRIYDMAPPWAKGLPRTKVPADEGDAFAVANHTRSLLGFTFASFAVAE